MLGYGGTSSPDDPTLEAFKYQKMLADRNVILSSCGIEIESGEKAHLVGHDFSAIFSSTIVFYYPQVALTCTLMSAPHSPPGRKMDLDVMEEITERELGFEFTAYRPFLLRDDSWQLIDAHKESLLQSCRGLTRNGSRTSCLRDA
ncbi:hypothetical protein BDV96DRAFT_234221 [Lophiotrema nucula]|uniref:Alpha/Beta hydrolase protein n=1 Tax=Lophiotrema nucula TaxID=690887 RepID=A0A6A5YRK2_9PLEO|nr:hypothetical protein BDV96DRAFT_234221 [Lophiotrema nucula]